MWASFPSSAKKNKNKEIFRILKKRKESKQDSRRTKEKVSRFLKRAFTDKPDQVRIFEVPIRAFVFNYSVFFFLKIFLDVGFDNTSFEDIISNGFLLKKWFLIIYIHIFHDLPEQHFQVALFSRSEEFWFLTDSSCFTSGQNLLGSIEWESHSPIRSPSKKTSRLL